MQNVLDKLSQLFSKSGKSPTSSSDPRLQRAYTMLLVDMALADQNFDPRERELVIDLLRKKFDLATDEVEQLVLQAVSSIGDMSSTAGFAVYIKDNLSVDERLEVMKEISALVVADQKKDVSELGLMRRMAELLDVPF